MPLSSPIAWGIVAVGLLLFAVDALFVRWRPAFPLLEDSSTGAPVRPAWHVKYLVLSAAFFAIILVYFNLVTTHNQQFSYLAQSFLRGKLFFLEPPGDNQWYDTVLFEGQRYWPLGAFPAVLLVPFVFVFNLFGVFFYQGWLQIALVAAIALMIFRIGRTFGYTRYDSVVWAFAFTYATTFLGVAILPWASKYAHVVATAMLFGALLEYAGKRRYWLIGLCLAGALGTRLTAGLVVIYFFAELMLLSTESRSAKLRSAMQLLLPVAIGFALVSLYNLARFGSLSEAGYSLQAIPDFLDRTRAYGLFSLSHLPGNLYFFFINGPSPVFVGDGSQVLRFPFFEADRLGMSVFITSPLFLYLFTLRYPERKTWLLFATALVVALPLFLYYGVGFSQLGYRYALDFLPLLYFALMQHYGAQKGRLSPGFRVLVVLSAFFNLYGFATIYWPGWMGV